MLNVILTVTIEEITIEYPGQYMRQKEFKCLTSKKINWTLKQNDRLSASLSVLNYKCKWIEPSNQKTYWQGGIQLHAINNILTLDPQTQISWNWKNEKRYSM